MKIADVELIVGKYVKDEVLPNIPNSFERFMVGAGATLVIGKGEVLVQKHLPMLKQMEIIDNDGNVDIDRLYTASTNGMSAAGGSVKYKSFTFNQGDVDKLYSMLKEQ